MSLAAHKVSIGYPVVGTLIRDVDLVVNDDSRIGLIGPNGSGKSSLLRILAGKEAPTRGRVTRSPGLRLGFLQQSLIEEPNERTLRDSLTQALDDVHSAEREMRLLEGHMGDGRVVEPLVMSDYEIACEQFEAAGGYEAELHAAEIADRLGFASDSLDRSLGSLSGGERERFALAVVLANQPNVLLLDEPTNHLDAARLDWLEEHLAAFRGGVVVATHDRRFLDATMTLIASIDPAQKVIVNFTGSFAEFAADRDRVREAWIQQFTDQERRVSELRAVTETGGATRIGAGRAARDNDKSAYNARGARVERASSRLTRSALRQLDRIATDGLSRPPDPLRITVRFAASIVPSDVVLAVESGEVDYDGNRVGPFSLEVAGDERLCLTGPNGVGKTTLLRMLAGDLHLFAGSRFVGPSVSIGYLPQEPVFDDLRRTVRDEMLRSGLSDDESGVWLSVSVGLLEREEVLYPLRELSVGQRRRVQIAQLIASRPNALLLDEPTNHIGLEVLESLEAGLREFAGPLVVVSHDRELISRLNLVDTPMGGASPPAP